MQCKSADGLKWGTPFKSPSEQASVAALISEPLVSPFKIDLMLSRDKSESRIYRS